MKSTLNLTLEAGALTEQVVVTADATTLRIGNSAVGEVFDDRTLVTLPVTERDPLQFTYHRRRHLAARARLAPLRPGQRRLEQQRRARSIQ